MKTSAGSRFNVFIEYDASGRVRSSVVGRNLDDINVAIGTWNGVCARTGRPLVVQRNEQPSFDSSRPEGPQGVLHELQGIADPQFICEGPVIDLCPTLIIEADQFETGTRRNVHECQVQLSSLRAKDYVEFEKSWHTVRFLDQIRSSAFSYLPKGVEVPSNEHLMRTEIEPVRVEAGMHLSCGVMVDGMLVDAVLLLKKLQNDGIASATAFFSCPISQPIGSKLIREVMFKSPLTNVEVIARREVATVLSCSNSTHGES